MADGDSTNNNHREEKRQRILRAAIDQFARKGYSTARMSDVAKAAGVADGTLYLYFEGKEHLLISIFDDVLSRFIGRLRQEISEVEDPLEKLAIMVRLHLKTVAADRALAHVLQIETRHSRRFMSLLTRGRLGEYLDLPPSHSQSYRYFMDEHLFKHINVDPKNIHVPYGHAGEVEEFCDWYEQEIQRLRLTKPEAAIEYREIVKTVEKEVVSPECSTALKEAAKIIRELHNDE